MQKGEVFAESCVARGELQISAQAACGLQTSSKKTVPKSTLNKEGTNCSREVKKELGEFCKATDSTKLRHPIDSYPCIPPVPHQSNQALTLEPRLGTADLDRLWGSNLGRGNGVGAS